MRSVPPVASDGLCTPFASAAPPPPPDPPEDATLPPPQAARTSAVTAPTAPTTTLRLLLMRDSLLGTHRDRGSSASRRPSPNRLKANTVTKIAKPGETMKLGAIW